MKGKSDSMEYIAVVLAIGSVLFIAGVVVPWACEHDGEGIIEGLKNTFKHR